ncbi:hypothetical protein MRX96_040081, partial [Rhipicephalus microplus]
VDVPSPFGREISNVDPKVNQSQEEGAQEGGVDVPPRQRITASAFVGVLLRSFSTALDDYQECRSLSHLGILMPVYNPAARSGTQGRWQPLLPVSSISVVGLELAAQARHLRAIQLRRGKLFVWACLCCFVSASLISGTVASTTLLYVLDRVLSTIFKQNMDRPPELFRGGSQQESSSLSSAPASDQLLFDRLSQVVLSMKIPESKKRNQRGGHIKQ